MDLIIKSQQIFTIKRKQLVLQLSEKFYGKIVIIFIKSCHWKTDVKKELEHSLRFRTMFLNLGVATSRKLFGYFLGIAEAFLKNTLDLELRISLENINTKTQRQIPIEDRSAKFFFSGKGIKF